MREAFQKTRDEEWGKFSRSQKVATLAINTLTFARPVLAGIVAWRGRDKSYKWTNKDAALLAAAYATDLEGNIARIMDAKTTFGGVADPLTDKVATAISEFTLASRGQESYARVILKTGRDVAISGLRRHVLKKTKGEVSVSAELPGRINSVVRQTVDVLATSPFGDKYPRLRNSLQIASFIGTMASGFVTGRNLFKALKSHRHR